MLRYALDCNKPGTADCLDQVNWAGPAAFALAEVQSTARKGEFLFRLHFVHFLSAPVLSAVQHLQSFTGEDSIFHDYCKTKALLKYKIGEYDCKDGGSKQCEISSYDAYSSLTKLGKTLSEG